MFRTIEDTRRDLARILSVLATTNTCALDIETTSLNTRDALIDGVAIAANDLSVYIPVNNARRRKPNGIELPEFREKIGPILDDPNREGFVHNCPYDRPILRAHNILQRHGFPAQMKLLDTCVMAWVYDEHPPHGLKEVVETYFGHKMVKFKDVGEQIMLPGIGPDFHAYAEDDARQTLRLGNFLRDKLQEDETNVDGVSKLWKVFADLENPITEVVENMQETGFCIDIPRLRELREVSSVHAKELRAEILTLAGKQINLEAPDDMRWLLFEKFGCPVKFTTAKEGLASTNADTLERLAEDGYEIAEKILEYRRAAKLVSSFHDNLLQYAMSSGGVIYPHFRQTGTVTGRLSSDDPNLQNIPSRSEEGRAIREAFVPSPGKVFIVSDYSMFELVLMAHYSGDREMTRLLRLPQEKNGPGDIHFAMQKSMGGVSRNEAKACVVRGTPVLTADGYIPIEDIVTHRDIGKGVPNEDILVRSYDQLRRVEATYYGGLQPCFRVTTELGTYVEQTGDHEVPVVRNGAIELVRTDSLRIGDLCLALVGSEVHGAATDLPRLPTTGATNFIPAQLPDKLTEDFAEFLGWVVSEGSVAHYGTSHSVLIRLGAGSTENVRRVRELGNLIFPGRCRDSSGKRAEGIRLSSRSLAEWLWSEGVGKNSHEHRIPKCVLRAPWKMKRSFFRGLFEGDGTVSGGVVRYASMSESLVRQLHAELLNVGIVGRIHREERQEHGPVWTWVSYDTAAFQEKIGFISQDKITALARVARSPTRSLLFLDGFEGQLRQIADTLSGTSRQKIRECLRSVKPVRLGQLRISREVRAKLGGDAKFLMDSGIWTVRIREVSPIGEREVFDIYEPEHTVMVNAGVVNGDCNFGFQYRMGAKKFAVKYKVPLEKATVFRKQYFENRPGVAAYHARVEDLVKRQKFVRSICGKKRRLERELSENEYTAVTQAINFTIQGSGADLIKIAMRNLFFDRFPKKAAADPRWASARIVSQIHDELIVECEPSIAEDCKKLTQETMESVATLRVPIRTEAHIGTSWAEAKG